MKFDDEPTDEELAEAADLFDISDVTEVMKCKGRREILLTFKASEQDFCLMKFYLSLKRYVDQIESAIGVSPEDGQEH